MADESNVPGIFKTLTSVAANRNWVSGATGVLFAFAALGGGLRDLVVDHGVVHWGFDGTEHADWFGEAVFVSHAAE